MGQDKASMMIIMMICSGLGNAANTRGKKKGERKKNTTDIFMIHMRKEFDLSKGSFCINPVVKGIPNFLDSNLLLCLRVVCRAVVRKLDTLVQKVIKTKL